MKILLLLLLLLPISLSSETHFSWEEWIKDTFLNEEDGQSYYQILIKTGERSLKTTTERFEILPGMVAQVDIKTGKKSVLDYLSKPLMRAKMNAFTER